MKIFIHMKKINVLFLKLIALICLGCLEDGENVTPDSSYELNAERCKLTGNEIREAAAKQKGTIGYVESTNQYFISFTPEGTYDTVIYGFVCNLPENLKRPGLSVLFSGKYFAYTDSLTPIFPGHEYYSLDISEYRLADANSDRLK